jgi:phosphopantetheine adenylyltransferase
MELKLLKPWQNRHGKEFKNGAVIDFGREKALKMIAEGVAVVIDFELETEAQMQEETEEEELQMIALKAFKWKSKQIEDGQVFTVRAKEIKVIQKMIEEGKAGRYNGNIY